MRYIAMQGQPFVLWSGEHDSTYFVGPFMAERDILASDAADRFALWLAGVEEESKTACSDLIAAATERFGNYDGAVAGRPDYEIESAAFAAWLLLDDAARVLPTMINVVASRYADGTVGVRLTDYAGTVEAKAEPGSDPTPGV